MEALGLKHAEPIIPDPLNSVWTFHSLKLPPLIVRLEPSYVPTAAEVLNQISEAAYSQGAKDRSIAIRGMLYMD